jgi:Tfp pilus assembly protein PilV
MHNQGPSDLQEVPTANNSQDYRNHTHNLLITQAATVVHRASSYTTQRDATHEAARWVFTHSRYIPASLPKPNTCEWCDAAKKYASAAEQGRKRETSLNECYGRG